MRVVILLPRQPAATGNEVTASRHRAGLTRLGHAVALVRVGLGNTRALRRLVTEYAPDVVHVLHAYRGGHPWLATGLASRLPWVVTLTGTDIHGGLERAGEGSVIREVLARAGAVITQNPLTARALREANPALGDRVRYLPPGIVLGQTPCPPLRNGWAASGTPLLLHPAGIRPVKGNVELLQLLDPLAAAGLCFAVGFCGPVLDEDYGRHFLGALASRPWARHLGVIPPGAMAAALSQSELVLNNSQSEGLPNALVEAAALGRPLLARDIPGNAAVVDPGVNGLLYADAVTFADQAEALIRDPALRRRLSAPRPERYLPARETSELLAIYRELHH